MFLILGFIFSMIFWITSIFLYIFVWFLWLKFKYYKNYDFTQQINFYSLLVFIFFSSTITFQFPFMLILIVYSLFLITSFWLFPRYVYLKKKAISFRSKAQKAISQKNYEEAWEILADGLYYADSMIPSIMGSVKSAIQIEMEATINLLQDYLKNEQSIPDSVQDLNKEFNEKHKFSKKEILKHSIKFLIITLITFLPLMVLYLSLMN